VLLETTRVCLKARFADWLNLIVFIESGSPAADAYPRMALSNVDSIKTN